MKRNTRNIFARLASPAAATILFAGAFFTRCASVGTPTGGPKDSLPPVIVGVAPADYSTHFKSDKILIEFDEYVQLKDLQKELYTSPAMKRKPVATLRGKAVQIQIKDDSLLPNTTYAVEFGSSVSDNNEGNPLHGLRYVFSTGDEIDSLMMSGYTEERRPIRWAARSSTSSRPIRSPRPRSTTP